MSEQEKIAILEDILELDAGELKKETCLSECEDWDSLAAISLIAIIDEKFGKTVSGKDIKACETVADVIELMR